MRLLLAVALALFAIEASPAIALEHALAPEIAQCITANASKVEIAISDLSQAVEFLIADICAEPLAAEATRESKRASERDSERLQKICDEKKEGAEKPANAATDGNLYSAVSTNAKFGFLNNLNQDDENGYVTWSSNATHPPAAIALASRLLLDLRLAHKVAKQ